MAGFMLLCEMSARQRIRFDTILPERGGSLAARRYTRGQCAWGGALSSSPRLHVQRPQTPGPVSHGPGQSNSCDAASVPTECTSATWLLARVTHLCAA